MSRPDRIESREDDALHDDDALLDQRLATLLRATPEPALPVDLAARAMRLAAVPETSSLARQSVSIHANAGHAVARHWVVLLNALAAVAVAAILLLGVWNLPATADDATASSDTSATSVTSTSQWSSMGNDELLIAGAILVAAAGAQIVLRGPVAFPRLPAVQPA